MTSASKELSIVEHLEELRIRLIKCILAVVVCSLAAYFYVDHLLALITNLTHSMGHLIFLKPTEAFVVRIKVAFYTGIFAAFPVLVYQLWKFISPGLRKSERNHIYWILPASYSLFVGGIMFAFFLVLPTGMKFLLSYGTADIQPMISISSYISFVSMFLLSFGVIFQFPLLIIFLTRIGLVTPAFLRKHRKYALIIIFIIAAIITPGPDVFSQFMMAIPMLFFYEISIWLSVLTIKKK